MLKGQKIMLPLLAASALGVGIWYFLKSKKASEDAQRQGNADAVSQAQMRALAQAQAQATAQRAVPGTLGELEGAAWHAGSQLVGALGSAAAGAVSGHIAATTPTSQPTTTTPPIEGGEIDNG